MEHLKFKWSRPFAAASNRTPISHSSSPKARHYNEWVVVCEIKCI